MKRVAGLLFRIVVFFVLAGSTLAYAAEEIGAESAGGDLYKFALALAAGFGMAIASAAGATAQGRSVTAAMEGIARNPEARAQMFVPLIVGLALIESLVIYTLVISILLIGKI